MSGILMIYSSLLAAIASLVLGCLILQKGFDQRINKLAGAMFLFGSLYFFAEYQYRSAESLERANLWLNVTASAFLTTSFAVHLTAHWSKRDRTQRSRILLLMMHISAALLTALEPACGFMGTLKMGSAGIWLRDTASVSPFGVGVHLWLLGLGFWVVAAGGLYYARLPGEERARQRHMPIGLLTPILLISVFSGVPRLLGAESYQLASVFAALGELVVFLGITRNHTAALTPQRVSQEIVNAMSEVLLLADPTGIIRAVNPAACALMGLTDLDMVGEPVSAFAELDWAQTELRAEETRLKTRDGQRIPVLFFRTPVYSPEGELQAMVCTAMDYTERNQAQAALRAALMTAEAATRAKSEFLATMSHELRTPMNAILGMTALLQETPLTQRQRDFVQTTRSSSATLLALINDILDYSRLEEERVELESVPFTLREVVEESLALLGIRASEKDLQLSVWIEDGLPEQVQGDPTRLRQILNHLITNAVKFTAAGEVVVTVRSGAAPEGKHELLFAVRDTGIGIPEDQRMALFESFSQLDSSRCRTQGGTGMGLAICRRLVSCMGGRLRVESEVGVGSTFQFSLVFEVCGPTQLRLVRASSAMTGRRAILVERYGTWRRILAHLLKSWGIEATATEDPAVALAALERKQHDLVLIAHELLTDAQVEAYAAADCQVVLVSPAGCERPSHGLTQVHRPVRKVLLKATLRELFSGMPAPAPQAKKPQPAQPSVPPLRILLAEDHLVNQKVALHMLQRWGLTADVAANGREALEAFERKMYDVVLMDVMMPEMDGLEATRLLRHRYADQDIQIIAVTANAMAGDRDRCFEAGVDDYISKPILTDCLESALLEAAERLGLSAA